MSNCFLEFSEASCQHHFAFYAYDKWLEEASITVTCNRKTCPGQFDFFDSEGFQDIMPECKFRPDYCRRDTLETIKNGRAVITPGKMVNGRVTVMIIKSNHIFQK